MPDKSLIERARAFAINAHQAVNHTRKYTGEPYAVHLQAVADMVTEVGGTPAMIAAAWLHDSVEDTALTATAIESEFGHDVALLVYQLTDVSKPADGNRATRKAMDRKHISRASNDAKTIKLADLIDNSKSIAAHDSKFATIYMAEKRLLLDALKGGHPILYERAAKIVNEYYSK